MSTVSNEEHITLLLSCIQHSTNGKIDFAAVAKDCNIVTGPAAAKRFSRLMAAHKRSTGADPSTSNAGPVANEQAEETEAPTAPAKKGRKRKVAATTTAAGTVVPKTRGKAKVNGDDAQPPKKRARVAARKAARASAKVIKEEEIEDGDEDESGVASDADGKVKNEEEDSEGEDLDEIYEDAKSGDEEEEEEAY
ncbi:uncharacterized protein BJX67DRAFT_379678 [Aspergillus lucknowensis]|uniref:Myb-like DNA-binding domain-containing protein n=1 Tax=Aspergillus lucknowensis TaxID=176173 RepID=A0ABR4LWF2_9EURO